MQQGIYCETEKSGVGVMKMATTATKYWKSKELSRMEAKIMLAIVL